MIKHLLVLFFMFGLAQSVYAGGIRTVYVDASRMKNIYLKMGQSTVLRFREKPKKVVLGNSNYYHVEFVDNDLTIQPQGPVSTNMFVYGEYHTFGFNLKINSGRFDDLVNVRWKSPELPRARKRKKGVPVKTAKNVGQSFNLGDALVFQLHQAQQNNRLQSTILDLGVENKAKEKVKTKEIKLTLTRGGLALPGQKSVFLDDEIEPGKKTKLRFFLSPIQKKGFSIEAKFKDSFKKHIVSRKYL